MTAPYLVDRAQAADVASAHGLRLESDASLAAVYGRWGNDQATLSVSHGDHGWWAAVQGWLPNGSPAGVWRSDWRPSLGSISRHVAAAIEDHEAERQRAA